MSYKLCFAYLSLIPIMLLDGQISFMMRSVFGSKIEILSFFMLIIFFHLVLKSSKLLPVCFSVFIGFLYDVYYLNGMSIMLISLPVATYFLQLLSGQMRKKVSSFQKTLLFFIFLFQILGLNFLIVRCYDLRQVAWSFFITYSLIPTFFFNIFLFVIITQYIKRVFY